MSTIEIVVVAFAAALLALGATALAILLRETRLRRKRERGLVEAIKLGTDALTADRMRNRGFIRAGEVDPESPLGRELIKAFGLDQPCQCPNCEEERRIQHAAERRDEK